MNHYTRFCPDLSHTIPGEHGGRVACFCERRESSQHYQDWIINQSTARSSHFPDEDDICVLGSHQHIRPPDRKRRPHWSPWLHRGGGVGSPQSCVFLYLFIFVFVYLYLVAKRGMGNWVRGLQTSIPCHGWCNPRPGHCVFFFLVLFFITSVDARIA